MGSDGLDFIFLGELVLGRAEPKTRKHRKPRKPELFGSARWPVGPRAGPNSWPDPNYFIFRAMGQRISGKLENNFFEMLFYGKFQHFLVTFLGPGPNFRAGPSLDQKYGLARVSARKIGLAR